eukprot:GEMP01010343.1.p1 GENE.GEMP01010343.1~~GEMP01010343.1.p1  ORF type:complete len:469 (+),score=104.82 GEMP01010343.1:161-1567(+)
MAIPNMPLHEPTAFVTPPPSAPPGDLATPPPSAPPGDLVTPPSSALLENFVTPPPSAPPAFPSWYSEGAPVQHSAPVRHSMPPARHTMTPARHTMTPTRHTMPPMQHTMANAAENCDVDHLEWRGSEMLGVTHGGVVVWYYRRHSPLLACMHPCSRTYKLFHSPESSISYEARGKCCFQTYHFAADDKEVATLTLTNWCANGWAYAVGLLSSAPSIVTLGTINLHREPRFRVLRKLEKGGTCCEFRSPCTCARPPPYAIVNQPIYDALNSRWSTVALSSTPQARELRTQVMQLRRTMSELEMSSSSGRLQRKTLKELQSENENLTSRLTMLTSVAHSESLLRRVGCLCCGCWEPVRVKVTPHVSGLTSDEIRALGLVSVAHLTRGLNGPLLRTTDENIGGACHRVSFNDMLKHVKRNSEMKDSARDSVSVCQPALIAPPAPATPSASPSTTPRPSLYPGFPPHSSASH